MSMSPEQENFESLRRLLALKRHEQPPPGYFNHFSSEVIARIRVERDGQVFEQSFLVRVLSGAPWLSRLWQGVEAKPAFAGVFGAAVCGLLVAGIVHSENSTTAPAVALLPLNSPEPMVTAFAPEQRPSAILVDQPLSASSLGAGSVPISSGSLFEELNRARANGSDRSFQPIRVSVGGN